MVPENRGPWPKIATQTIDMTVTIQKTAYNILRSLIASKRSIKCYEYEKDGEAEWWCEKKTVSGLRWRLVPVGYEGYNAVAIFGPRDTVVAIIVEPAGRPRVAIEVGGLQFKAIDLEHVAVIANVPLARPIRLIEIVDAVDSIVDWGY